MAQRLFLFCCLKLVERMQSSHEVHTAKLDALEDRLVGKEVGAANTLADKNNAWQQQRHRSVCTDGAMSCPGSAAACHCRSQPLPLLSLSRIQSRVAIENCPPATTLLCRDRMSEVLAYLERNIQDLDVLAADVTDAEDAAEAQGL